MRTIENVKISSAMDSVHSPYQRFEDEQEKPYEPQSLTATAFIEDDAGEKVNGAYFFRHDSTYRP